MVVFTFTRPQYLFFLFLIPFFFMIHFLSLSNRKKTALRFANFDAISRIRGIDFFSKNLIVLFFNVLIIFLIILALSGLNMQITKQVSSFSFVIAIDNSESMLADDFSPDRITVAKELAEEFVDRIPVGSKIGVVSFSGNSYIEQDMSMDKVIVKNSINSIEIKGWGGTDVYEALITSANMLEGDDNKAVIILSDGQINIGKIEDMISYSQKKEILIHTIAIGTKEGGNTPYAVSKLDEDFLNALAYNTGGRFFSAQNRDELFQSLLEALNITERKVSIDLVSYLILFVILLFTIEVILTSTRYLNLL